MPVVSGLLLELCGATLHDEWERDFSAEESSDLFGSLNRYMPVREADAVFFDNFV